MCVEPMTLRLRTRRGPRGSAGPAGLLRATLAQELRAASDRSADA